MSKEPLEATILVPSEDPEKKDKDEPKHTDEVAEFIKSKAKGKGKEAEDAKDQEIVSLIAHTRGQTRG
jgi:hypothetical protein